MHFLVNKYSPLMSRYCFWMTLQRKTDENVPPPNPKLSLAVIMQGSRLHAALPQFMISSELCGVTCAIGFEADIDFPSHLSSFYTVLFFQGQLQYLVRLSQHVFC